MSYEIVTGAMDPDLAALLSAESSGEIEIVGAAMAPGNQEALKQQLLAKNAVLVQRNEMFKRREFPLGFDSEANVGAGATITVTTQPQIPFRVERLVVPSDLAGSFVVEELTVGKNPQLAAVVGVPARVFDERAVGVRLHGDTAQVSQNVSLRITNISGAAVRFRACVIGTALD